MSTHGKKSRGMLLRTPPAAPTAQEIALRPDLVRNMLTKVNDLVYEHDIEHCVVIGITTDGSTKVYHSYGQELPLEEVAQLLEDIATTARNQAGENT